MGKEAIDRDILGYKDATVISKVAIAYKDAIKEGEVAIGIDEVLILTPLKIPLVALLVILI